MALKPLKRKYHMSDASLGDLAGVILYAGARDLADFAIYNVTQATLDDIEAKGLALANHPNDEYYAGLLMEAVDDRTADIFTMSEAAKAVVLRGETQWGKDNSKVKKFSWEGYASKKDAEKILVCRQVHKIGTDNLGELSAQGLTQAILDDLLAKIEAATDAYGLKLTRVGERDEGTKTRITLGNTFYAALVSLANIGKSHWENVDESKYNDYVIYTSADPLQVVTGTAAPEMVIEPSVTVDSPNDNVQVKNLGTKPLNVYFGDDPTDLPQGAYVTVAAGTEPIFKAVDIGYTSTMNRLLLYNPDTVDSVAYEVRVS